MTSSDPSHLSIHDYLPTVEAAVRAGLLEQGSAPQFARKLAALLVIAKLARRETWREEKLLQGHEAHQLPTQAPPFAPGSFRSWKVGMGKTGVLLEHVTDKIINFWDVFIPSALNREEDLFGVESAIEELVPGVPNAIFECQDLRTEGQVSAYRGQISGARKPMFHEHDFEDAIELGKAATIQLYQARGRLVSADVKAYAWPLLWVRLSDDAESQMVILPDGHGQLHALRDTDLMRRDDEKNR